MLQTKKLTKAKRLYIRDINGLMVFKLILYIYNFKKKLVKRNFCIKFVDNLLIKQVKMKINNLVLVIIILLLTGFKVLASEMILKGIYQGKDLYIINPMLDVGEEYCVYEVLINNEKYDEVINSSAFRISLDYAGLQYGQEYVVTIRHHEFCTPKLVNPEVLKPLCTYEIISHELGFDNVLRFITANESGKLTFYVEEFRWGKWIEIGQMPGEGGPGNRSYSIKTYPFNGENRFRVYQIDHLKRKVYSDEIVYNITKDKIKIMTKLSGVSKEIVFSDNTSYEVINEFGEELITGVGNVVNVSRLDKGQYFLNFENEYTLFIKR